MPLKLSPPDAHFYGALVALFLAGAAAGGHFGGWLLAVGGGAGIVGVALFIDHLLRSLAGVAARREEMRARTEIATRGEP